MSDNPEAILLDGILDSLEDMGYSGPMQDSSTLQTAIEQGLTSSLFIDLCTILCNELKQLLNLQEAVSRPQGQDDCDSFELEIRSFLKELHCPHTSLINERDILISYKKKLLMMDFLLSEVLTARMLSLRKKDEERMEVNGEHSLSVQGNLEAILKVYGIPDPPSHVTVKQVFDRIIGKTRDVLSQRQVDVGCPLLTQPLSVEQWSTLEQINDALTQEYSVRRQMLLTRCDVTVQSFRWSDRIKSKLDEFSEVYQSHREQLKESAPVSVARILAAREDMLEIEKTNSVSVRARTQCAINRVLIGKVPDRGGRPQEARPPPEMPVFKKRTEAPQDQRQGGYGRGKGGGKGGGGRVQGGWSGGHGGHKGRGGGWHQKSGGGGHHGYSGKGGHSQQYFS